VLIDHSNEPMMRLLINKTRTAELSGPALAEAHRDVGKQLAGSIAQHVQLEEIAIHHVAGASTGVQIKPGSEPIICLTRPFDSLATVRAERVVAIQ
jgi:hypothetical protein